MFWLFAKKRETNNTKKEEIKNVDKKYLYIRQHEKLPVSIPLKRIPDLYQKTQSSSNGAKEVFEDNETSVSLYKLNSTHECKGFANFYCDTNERCISYDEDGAGHYLWSLSEAPDRSTDFVVLRNVEVVFPVRITSQNEACKCSNCKCANSKEIVITAKSDRLIVRYLYRGFPPLQLEDKYKDNIDRIAGLVARISSWEETK